MEKTKLRLAAEKDRQKSQERIEGAKLGVQIAETNTRQELESKKIASKDKVEGAKLGVQIARELLNAERDNESGRGTS